MSERKPGFYWVKAGQEFPWEVDEWSHDNWVSGAVLGTKSPTIGPRIPSPDEPWVTVPVEPSEVMKNEADYNTPGPMTAWKCWQVMLSVAPTPGDEQ